MGVCKHQCRTVLANKVPFHKMYVFGWKPPFSLQCKSTFTAREVGVVVSFRIVHHVVYGALMCSESQCKTWQGGYSSVII